MFDSFFTSRGLDPKFGYGGVSSHFLRSKKLIIEDLEDPDFYCDLWEIVEVGCGGYDNVWDSKLRLVVEDLLSSDPKGIFLSKTNLNILESDIEILNYILCSADICNYGTSPRFPWLTSYGKYVLNLYKNQIKGGCNANKDN